MLLRLRRQLLLRRSLETPHPLLMLEPPKLVLLRLHKPRQASQGLPQPQELRKGADAQPKDTLGGIAAASAKAALIAAGQAAGGKAGDAVAGSGGAAAAKSTGDQAATAAVKAASGALPGGGGNYCRVDETHVEFHAPRPVPIAAQLLRVFPLEDGKWNLLGAIVKFDGEKTTEISQ